MAVPGVKMKEQKRKDMIASDSSLPERATDRGNQVNLLSLAAGRRFLARGQVVKPGRTIMVCTGEVMVVRDRTAVLV
jgi:acyl-coenzyme A thioesterase PaaI-like protein